MEPSSPDEKEVDYNQEYLERFARLKVEAEAQGLRYDYPHKAGIGWKLHLGVRSLDPSEVKTKNILNFLKSKRLLFKLGQSAYQAITVYVGDRDTTEDVALELSEKYGDSLVEPDPGSEITIWDMPVAGRITGRFENSLDDLKNPQLRQHGSHKYDHYGPLGVPSLSNEFITGNRLKQKDLDEDVKAQAAESLAQDYGAFFTGTRSHPI